MKKIKYILMLLSAVLVIQSCSDGLSDLNVNPDKAPNANPEEVFTSAIAYMSYVQEADYNRLSFIWAQYWTWGPGVALGNIERYNPAGSDYNNGWIRCYANALSDLRFVSNSDSKSHAGAAKVLTAYIYQGLVDHFGDVPFSEALNGELADGSNFAPKFDDDQEIYSQLVPMIDAGIADLNSGDGMGGEDLIYGGDTGAWIRFANSLKLRILMRQSSVVDVAQQVKDLVSVGNFIESTGDVADVAFAGSAGDENPMYARMESGVKNFYIASNTSLNYLADHSDPRIDAFYAPAATTGTLIGIDQGTIDDEPPTASVGEYSQMTSLLYGADLPVILMSHWEVWFLRAEAANKFRTSDDETTAFENAVSANFDYLGVSGASAYLSNLDYASGDDQARLNNIAIQKWISMNGLQEDEGWIETRRFDTPSNPLFSQMIFVTPKVSILPENVHPSIWLYPANELSLNPSAPSQRVVTEKVFWDE